MKLSRSMEGDKIVLSRAGERVLTIDEAEKDGSVVLTLDGMLISDTALNLGDELRQFSSVGVKRLVLDMKKVSSISNSCMKALLEFQLSFDKLEGELLLKNVAPVVFEEFARIGYHDLLNIQK